MDNSTIDLHGCLIEPAFMNILKEYLVFEDLPAKCLPSISTSVRPRYPKIEDDGKRFLKQMFDNCPLLSRTRVEMYGSPEELAENLKIYSDFPSNHRVFGFPQTWPFNTTITKYKSIKTEEEFIYKHDLFTYIHHLALKYFGRQCPVLAFQTLFLKQFGEFYDDRCEFIKYDQVWMNNLKKKYTKVWKKAQRLVKDPNFKHDNIYTSVTPLFTDMMPNWMKRKEDMHLLPTPVVVRVFNDEFVFEKEFMDAMKFTGNCHSSLVLSSKPLFPVIIPLTSLTGYNIFTDSKNVKFVKVPIKRAKHAATPILSPYGGHCISSVDAFLQILRVLIFRHRIFQRFKKHQWQTVKTVLSILGQTFTPHMRPHFISVSTIARLKTSLAEQMEPYNDIPFREFRRVDHEGFSLEDLKDELNHSKLDECFPEIGRYARSVYEEVDKRKVKSVLRTCDFYDALEQCQVICFLERMGDLKIFLHQQQGCSRVPQLHCDYCKPPPLVPKRYLKTHVIEYKIDEMTVTYLIDKEEDLASCTLVSDELKREFYSNMKYFSPAQAQDYGVKFFILDSNDVVKRERGIRMLSSLRNYVKVHPFKKLYLRAIPTNTFIESRRVFTEEVLEIVQILLKLRTNDARLRHYRKKWPPRKNVTIDSTELRLVLEDFDVDKERITLIPDASHEITVYRMLTEPNPLYLQVPSPIGKQMIMRPYQLIYFLFRRVVCSLNWNKERCKIHEDCLEGFRMVVLGKMREIAEFDENAYIPTTILDNILQDYQQLCPFLYSNPPKVTPMSALSVYSYDETISNDRFQTISRLFGLEDFMEPDEEEEEEKEDIRIDMARYRILEALISQFVRGEANEIEMILTDELWTCNSPRVEGIRKPRGVLTSNEGMIKFENARIAIQKKKPKKRLAKTGTDSVGTKNSDGMDPEAGGFVEEIDETSKLDSEDADPEREDPITMKKDQKTKNDEPEVDGVENFQNDGIPENPAGIGFPKSQDEESEHLECMASVPEVEAAQKPGETVEILTDGLINLKLGERNEDQVAENVENATETAFPDKMTKECNPEHQPDIEKHVFSQSEIEMTQKSEEDVGADEEYYTLEVEDGNENINMVVGETVNDQKTIERNEKNAQEPMESDLETNTESNQNKVLEVSTHLESQVLSAAVLDMVVAESDKKEKPEDHVVRQSEGHAEIGEDMEADEHENLKVEEGNEMIVGIGNVQTIEKSDPKHLKQTESDWEDHTERCQHEVMEVSLHLEPQVQVETPPDIEMKKSKDEKTLGTEINHVVSQSEENVKIGEDIEADESEDLEMVEGKVTSQQLEIVNDQTADKSAPKPKEHEERDTKTQSERNEPILEPQVHDEFTGSDKEKEKGFEIEIKDELTPDDVSSVSCELGELTKEGVEPSSERSKENSTENETENEESVHVENTSGDIGTPKLELFPETKTDTCSKGDTELDLPKCTMEVKSESESCDDQEATEVVEAKSEMEAEEILENHGESVEDENPAEDPQDVTKTKFFSQLEKKESVELEVKEEYELSDLGNGSCEVPEAKGDVEVNPGMSDEKILVNYGKSVEDETPSEIPQDIRRTEFSSPPGKKEDVEIEVNEELELSDISDDSWEDPNPMVTEPVDENPEIKDEEIPKNQQVEPEIKLEQTLKGDESENPSEVIFSPLGKKEVAIKEDVTGDSSEDSDVPELSDVPMNQKVENDSLGENHPMNPKENTEEHQNKTLPPLHVEVVEVRNPRASHAEMKDSGCSEASTVPELVTEEFRTPVFWKHVETQTSIDLLPGSQSKDKEIEGLKRANLQIAQQNKSRISQLQEKFDATKSQMSQRIKELEEELRMERDKVATPCNNNEVEELKKTIKVLQDNNAALTIRDEEKAKMIKMLMDCLKGNSERSVGEGTGNKTP